jgi:hypothetical protein
MGKKWFQDLQYANFNLTLKKEEGSTVQDKK